MIKKVNILSVDKNEIVKVSEAGANVYGFFVNISINPGQEWKGCFKNEWEKQQNNLIMPKIMEESARIQVRFSFGETLQTYISELVTVVEKCNDFIWQCDVENAKRIAEMRKKEADNMLNIAALKEELKTLAIN